VYSIERSLNKINKKVEEIDFFEINEAFSVVALANQKLLNIDINKLNVNGGIYKSLKSKELCQWVIL
jgi:acetyl-CoA C-acetyltransferase